MQDTSNSILAQDESTFNVPTDELMEQVTRLTKEGTQEAKDQLIQLGLDHGVPVMPEMEFEEIKARFEAVISA